ncbi:Muskelin N-terminus-domain-containing protein [Flammula alnicola]|nr:Muskelin N-terminus-domain-containing protein [Flammula alnicola]
MSNPQRPSTPPSVPLTYTIASSTPHSGKYGPENIIVDKPQDQASRWSGAFQGNANQWIMLRLESLAVLKMITFGKFSKPHPCNMKELKVFVGMSEDHMTEVLHAGLKNDTIPETFPLKYVNNSGVDFPTQYVKIVPIIAHGQNFHISIWHVSMTGILDPTYVEKIRYTYDEFRETAVLRYVLKHLRQRRLLTPYQSILSRANIQLEHPLVTQLHESLVLQGNWSNSEKLLDSMSSSGLFNSHLNACQPRSVWTRLSGTDADGDIPPARGGHAMCMDPVNEMIYVFGGWNGEKSLDDFWVYSVKEDKWKVLSHSTTQEQNAPGARSCHKMVFDSKTGSIYLLGRLNDEDGLREPTPVPPRVQHGASGAPAGYQLPTTQQQQPGAPLAGSSSPDSTTKMFTSEFYRYHTRGVLAGKWDFLSIDTASSGGPPLIFDHQMAMDSDAQILYVFGGRVVDGDWDNFKYSGLYSYNVSTSKWKSLQQPLVDPLHGSQVIPSRFGHSMVLDPVSKTLYIFAGQREDKYLSDMYTYNLNTGVATEIFSNFTAAGGPDACFTQRAVIDPELKEIYVFCGLTRSPTTGPQNTLRAYLSNWVYRYDTRPGKWMQILRQPDRPPSELPLPRFAHQVVYNPSTKSVFLHGGNAGGAPVADGGRAAREADEEAIAVDSGDEGKDGPAAGTKERRLDDFWRMELKRPGPEEIIRQAKSQIRQQQFREMCEEEAPVKALNFLQTQVSSVVDHSNAKETEIFRSLLTHLLSPASMSSSSLHSRVSSSASMASGSSLSSSASSVEHEDSREVSNRPLKRSRAEREGSGVWTNELSEDDSPKFMGGGMQRLRDMTDPLEAVIRGEDGESLLTGARYSQRTEVFESILKFVEDGEKQPSESLLDLVERDRCRVDVF